ncbi:MAG: 30S ribosomal protein S20 [Opitutales bacterium]|nr:30S ribosomal protein S20 [Opitutales bacterium]
MANIKANKKSIRQTATHTAYNRSAKSALKTIAKGAKAAVASGNAEAIKAATPVTASAFDKAAKKGIIHPNKAARIKSRLAKAANNAAK